MAGYSEPFNFRNIYCEVFTRVTNKSGSNTPTITITNNGFQVINTQTLVAATSVEILTNPMVVEGQYGSFLYDSRNRYRWGRHHN